MPKVSVVVPVFNKAASLPLAIECLSGQTLADIEMVFVDDASTDGSAEVLEQAAEKDKRVRLIRHKNNEGTLVARRTGIRATTGDYVTFLDPDDELRLDTCEQIWLLECQLSTDILHFGVKVVPEGGVSSQAASDMEAFMIPRERRLSGESILLTAFSSDGFDWNLAHKAFRGDLIRSVSELLPDVYLTRAEDAYTFFLAAAMARSYRAVSNSQWYVYHFGSGASSTESMSLDSFKSVCAQDHLAVKLASAHLEDPGLTTRQASIAVEMLQERLADHVMNTWKDAVAPEDQRVALEFVLELWPHSLVLAALYRYLRDAAYAGLVRARSGEPYAEFRDAAKSYQSLADEICARDQRGPSSRLHGMKSTGLAHLDELKRADARDGWASSPVRIFIPVEHECIGFDTQSIQPIQSGASATDSLVGAFHDNEGENIASKSERYGLLTVLYWMWKNVHAEYYGLCEPECLFDFSRRAPVRSGNASVEINRPNGSTLSALGIDDASINHLLSGVDIVTTSPITLRKSHDAASTPRQLLLNSLGGKTDFSGMILDALSELCPDYVEDAAAYFDGRKIVTSSMFVMRARVFQDYCSWIFRILFKMESQIDWAGTSQGPSAQFPPVSVHLLNIFVGHQLRLNTEMRVCHLQIVRLKHFSRHLPPSPVLPLDVPDGFAVPVVLISSGRNAPQLSTTIYSTIVNAAPWRPLDILVFHRGIRADDQREMREAFSCFSNVSIRFYDSAVWMHEFGIDPERGQLGLDQRILPLIQHALVYYDKVLYLTPGDVVLGDIGGLFDVFLGDSIVGAVPDIDHLARLNSRANSAAGSKRSTSRKAEPSIRFATNVLLMNLDGLRHHISVEDWRQGLRSSGYSLCGEDFLNVCCEGQAKYLDWEWGVSFRSDWETTSVLSNAPADSFAAYCVAKERPKIVCQREINEMSRDWLAPGREPFWCYARQTPFYERMLQLHRSRSPQVDSGQEELPSRSLSEHSPLRRILDPLLPLGSRRREALKAIGRAIRHR